MLLGVSVISFAVQLSHVACGESSINIVIVTPCISSGCGYSIEICDVGVEECFLCTVYWSCVLFLMNSWY